VIDSSAIKTRYIGRCSAMSIRSIPPNSVLVKDRNPSLPALFFLGQITAASSPAAGTAAAPVASLISWASGTFAGLTFGLE